MKRIFCLFLLLLICFFCTPVFGATLYTEDFENWTGQQTPGNSYDETSFSTNSGRSNTYAHGGTYSGAGYIGSENGFYLRDTFTEQASSTWIWLTFWVYYPSDYTPSSGCNRVHMTGMEYGSVYVQMDQYTPASNSLLCATTWNDNQNTVAGVTYASLQGAWHKIQLGYQYSTKSYEVWVDDVQKLSDTEPEWSGTETTDTIMIRFYDITACTVDGAWYVDDVSVDTDTRPTGNGGGNILSISGGSTSTSRQ